MKSLIKHIIIIILSLLFFYTSSAQLKPTHKVKLYQTWVSLKNTPDKKIKGLLYEIRDSAITIITSPYLNNYSALKTDTIRINYNDINIIKTRRIKNIGRGILVGSTAGYASGATFVYSTVSGEELAGLIAFEVGFGYAIFGAGVGALVGSIKDRIPVKGSLENFNLYRSVLQDYSYIQEFPESKFLFEHRGFIDIALGPSFTIGYFKDLSTGTKEIVKPGFCGNFTVGYRFTRRFGIAISEIDNEYSVDKDLSTLNWGLGSILVGPIFSKSIGKKAYFDLKPSIGYSTMDYYIYDIFGNTTFEKNAIGFGFNLNASLSYYISNQWGLSAEVAYFDTHQIFDHNQKENYKSFNLSIGAIYRFSRKSL